MTRQKDVRRSNESPQKKGSDDWILQRSAVRELPAKTLTQQTETVAGVRSGINLDLMQIPVSNYSAMPVQAKLEIRPANDKYEQEADRVAKLVVQQLHGSQSGKLIPRQTLQRQGNREVDEELQRKPRLQLKGGREGMTTTPELESSIARSRGSGQPLSQGIREPMEKAFGGVDFSGVKVHTDGQSDRLNQSMQAKAFTTGQDVFFRQGAYAPGSRDGKELIAHELTHVVQQKDRPMIQRTNEKTNKKTNNNVDKPAKLHLHADLDAPDKSLIEQLKSGEVGHAWISLQWKDPNNVPSDMHVKHKDFLSKNKVQADPMGFWPKMFDSFDPIQERWSSLPDDQRASYSTNPFRSYVPGQMVHPDNLHTAKATQSYDITRPQADAVINYAESKRNAQYSVFFYNCTTFAKEAVKAGGQSPPQMGKLGICYPDALYKSIVKSQKKSNTTP
ncbi:DUF4157 domain-containing protein [Moorena producens]|uniref:eCIS core domain-containing protein n=1 Tax=Moorena producens TaxID=1155739 RepID=UPI003C7092AD